MHFPCRILPFLALLLTCNMTYSKNVQNASSMAQGFQDPPLSVRPRAFWDWLNGNVDRERIIYDLDQMKEKGMGGAEIWDVAAIHNADMIPGGPRFLDPESADIIKFALREGGRRGLRMGMITSSGWNAGGTWVTPDWASKMLVSNSIVMEGGKPYDARFPFPVTPKECPKGPDGMPVYYKDIALLAMPESADKTITSTTEIIDLSKNLTSDGTLQWTPPAGQWRVFRFVCTNTGQSLIVPSPNSKGLFIDFLDPDATRRHFGEILKRLDINRKNSSESGLKYLEVDSMELHEGNPWTDNFARWFFQHYGYDLVKYLPALEGWTIQSADVSAAVLYDYRRAVSDLLIHSHYETGSAFLKDYGIDLVGEAGGPGPPIWNTCPVDALKALGNVTIPRGEFWVKHRNMFLIKEIASASHIYGKSVVDAESFTTWRRFQDSPFDLKPLVDRAFAEGLNQITIHTFSHSPAADGLPGRTYHAGIDINPNVTWWPMARAFMDYLARCSYVLQQGNPVADVLWYYGDQAPNFFPPFHNVPEKPRLPGLGKGYDFDVVNSDVILNRLQVKGGRYTLPEGTNYKILATADDAAVSLEVLEKITDFVNDGGVLAGHAPRNIPGLKDRDEKAAKLKQLVARLWSESPTTGVRTVGHGKVYTGIALDEVLSAEKIQPDFQVAGKGGTDHIDFIHRVTPEEDIYFVRNETTASQQIQISVRSQYSNAEVWEADTGNIRPVKLTASSEARKDVEIALDPYGSTFVVLSNRRKEPGDALLSENTEPIRLTSLWTLTFPPDLGAPTRPIELRELTSWTDFKRFGIKYFSGIAEYSVRFELPENAQTAGRKNSRRYLDLGDVRDVAEVIVNNQPAGVAWKKPYRVDITDQIKPGENTLEIRVANLWNNRLFGDTKTTSTITRSNVSKDQLNKGLLASGLLGPVSIVYR